MCFKQLSPQPTGLHSGRPMGLGHVAAVELLLGCRVSLAEQRQQLEQGPHVQMPGEDHFWLGWHRQLGLWSNLQVRDQPTILLAGLMGKTL